MNNPDEDVDSDWKISHQLVRTWPAFFAIHGRLTTVQRASIPPILDGCNVLVCSATASGKTEAACAPLIERNLDSEQSWTILYISPTRALVNDLYERLQMPTTRLGVSLVRRTGDHRSQLKNIPNILLTTPESFDSLLCRGKRSKENYGHVLSQVTSVVIDEVHLFYGKSRGEQVKWLLERLRRLKIQAKDEGWANNDKFQIVCLSATVQDPIAVSSYFMDDYHPPIIVSGGRDIEVISVPSQGTNVESALPEYIKLLKVPEKILVFCNSRRRVDKLTAYMRPILGNYGYKVKAHHGSLSKLEREEAEDTFKNENKIIIFATQTLELGIDIGNIDLIILDGLAPDISSLLQRIGRGNRRTNKSRVMPCVSSVPELVVQSAMLEAASDGWLGDEKFGPNHAVSRQQIISYIFQHERRARSRHWIEGLMAKCAHPIIVSSLIDHMVSNEELIENEEGIRLSDYWLDEAYKGTIHSNIEKALGETVIDETTGNEIAHGINYDSGSGLNIGGNLLEIKRWRERKLEVKKILEKDFVEGSWRYTGRGMIKSAGQSKAIRRYLGIEENVWPFIFYNGKTYVFHLYGPSCASVMDLIISGKPRFYGVNTNEWFIEFPIIVKDKPIEFSKTMPGLLMLDVSSRIDSLEYSLGRPFANKTLPMDVRIDEVTKWLNLEEELERIKNSVWLPADGDIRLVLASITH